MGENFLERSLKASGYRLKIYVYKKEKYIGTYEELTHHHSIPEKEKTKARGILKLPVKCSTPVIMMSFWCSGKNKFFFIFYEGLKV